VPVRRPNDAATHGLDSRPSRVVVDLDPSASISDGRRVAAAPAMTRLRMASAPVVTATLRRALKTSMQSICGQRRPSAPRLM
jgi:hypothetical protein